MRKDRRTFLTSLATAVTGVASASGAGIALVGCSRSASNPGTGPTGAASGDKDKDDDEVTPAEDLMREHGVLRRVMYLYDDAADRLTGRFDDLARLTPTP